MLSPSQGQRERDFLNQCQKILTSRDIGSSATAQDLPQLYAVLRQVPRTRISKMVDLGCGYGGLTECMASYFQVREAYGIDSDRERLLWAANRGIKVHALNLEHDPLPFDDGSIDLVTSLGVLEHLKYYDNPISETSRILTKGGYFLMSMPNLASYVNRIAVLFGYQPRDVELSSK